MKKQKRQHSNMHQIRSINATHNRRALQLGSLNFVQKQGFFNIPKFHGNFAIFN